MALTFFKRATTPPQATWRRGWTGDGVVLDPNGPGTPLQDPLLLGFVAQLRDDGLLSDVDDRATIGWDALFEALAQPGYVGLSDALLLPPHTDLSPALLSANSLTDPDFAVAIDGWRHPSGRRKDPSSIGAVLQVDGREELMRPDQWRLVSAVIAFANRSPESRHDLTHRLEWGRLRRLAQAAGARLDDFLYRSVVLTPERLSIALRKSADVSDDTVIEISPLFEGAPADWLERFDAMRSIPDRYDIVTEEGIVQVLVSSKVRTVLEEIKRLPGRRVAGARAQAFLLNPFAALGDDARDVIVEGEFEQAREEAGLHYERFVPVVERDDRGFPHQVGLLIETASMAGPISSQTHWFTDESLAAFVRKLGWSIERGFPLVAWDGFDLELQGDAEDHLRLLTEVLEARHHPPPLITYEQVHDLSAYSSRVEAIGVDKPYYSPYIASKKKDWFPENVIPLIAFTPEGETDPVAVPVTPEAIERLRKAVAKAEESGVAAVTVPWLPKPIPVNEATNIVETFDKVLGEVKARRFVPTEPAVDEKQPDGPKKHLILRSNIQTLDYAEHRKDALEADPGEPEIPVALRPDFPLLPHQCDGVAWLQHLYRSRDAQQVRGAVLADDMGLGKTLQLLTFMAWLTEQHPGIDPMLVVAPVSLLENWKQEKEKFFQSEALPLLTAYGESLAPLRVPKEAIDQRLRSEDGLVRFLKPNWIGGAKLVLTTYETLRDLEFSFSSQRWSVMICDEAQRIKNPAAMVTRAAKKQNVAFKIACTGTPVENTLADLWCLFDFVQPGLLGALDDFGRRYRKPIEARSDEEKARVEELRSRISPQILRRTKAEVAKNLPEKIIVEACRQLQMSQAQRHLYGNAIESFRKRGTEEAKSPFKNHLGLLHYLRLICTDPRHHGQPALLPDPLIEYRAKSPKMHWLLDQLHAIRTQGEKAIVFCEFRDIQRLLQHYIREVFDLSPVIINGDTSASEANANSRQKQLHEFQKKPGFGVIILSPIAVGFGVNIQAANHVIHFTRTWNPAKEDQATDRAYRIGQTKNVHVYYPVVRARDFQTFDVILDKLLDQKRELASDMLNGSGDIAAGEFVLGELGEGAAVGR